MIAGHGCAPQIFPGEVRHPLAARRILPFEGNRQVRILTSQTKNSSLLDGKYRINEPQTRIRQRMKNVLLRADQWLIHKNSDPTKWPASGRPNYPVNFFAAMVELWPPKPNELLTMALTVSSRAVLGT